MNVFEEYLQNIPFDQQATLKHILQLVRTSVPEATEGYSYGFPSFKYYGRPLIGFGYKDGVFSVYPFDPKIISSIENELSDHVIGKGFVRFTHEQPISDSTILLMIDLRLGHLRPSKT